MRKFLAALLAICVILACAPAALAAPPDVPGEQQGNEASLTVKVKPPPVLFEMPGGWQTNAGYVDDLLPGIQITTPKKADRQGVYNVSFSGEVMSSDLDNVPFYQGTKTNPNGSYERPAPAFIEWYVLIPPGAAWIDLGANEVGGSDSLVPVTGSDAIFSKITIANREYLRVPGEFAHRDGPLLDWKISEGATDDGTLTFTFRFKDFYNQYMGDPVVVRYNYDDNLEIVQQVLMDNGGSFDADEIQNILPGVTVVPARRVAGVTLTVYEFTFSGDAPAAELEAGYPELEPGNRVAYLTWYALVPDGTTQVSYDAGWPNDQVVTLGEGPYGQVVDIDGHQYLRVIGEFARKDELTGQWRMSEDVPGSPGPIINRRIRFLDPQGAEIPTTRAGMNAMYFTEGFQVLLPPVDIQVSWVTDDPDALAPDENGFVNAAELETFRLGVNVRNSGTDALDNALIVLTVVNNDTNNPVLNGIAAAPGSDPVALDSAGSFFYVGPREGYTIASGWNDTMYFDFTFFDTADYTIHNYAVRVRVVKLNQP